MAIHKTVICSLTLIFVGILLLATEHQYNILPTPLKSSGSSSGSTVKPRFIFVDLGANAADSLEVFLRRDHAKYSYDFPRPDWATYEQAEIYLFEANPHFNRALVTAKERYSAQGMNINIFPSTVVDVRDGTRTFFLDTINDANDFWGSSVYANHPDAIGSKSNGTELTSINIARWLLMNTLPRDFVVVKMDIEGAEYEIIPHMAEMGASIVTDYLLIEWHPTIPEDIDTSDARAKAAIEKLKAGGVNMPDYDSAS
ncbi:uncharacterized protein A1O9_11857 [Exophiala aquamarina CBS 119918]|uniref:Methyltransferase FkbM domain-containing protein n=1 Tax=Exophiala aquamarina CBS 119918 TaxID=1182545 RepID=A0A072P9J0_9EURO|nr:uncharacterized protein A1O9_11857 [Exophiala aquamarina CBS 119918]KEF52230.1 hypothetical protein A1O9_11857 [Exophiala aquamarina CBS 119918]